MGRDKGQAKGGKGGAIAPAAASKGSSGTPAQLAVRPEECPICGHDVAVSEEQHILGTCGACAGHPYHIDCVQEFLEKTLRPQIREGGYGTKAWERVQQKIKTRPCDMFATNGTSQRLPVNCPACKSGVMLAADMVKPVRKLTPAPPVAPPKQPRSQQPAAAAPASNKGPITPPPSGNTYARQSAAAPRSVSLAGDSMGSRSGSGLARAGGGVSGALGSGATRPDPIPSRPAWLRLCNSVLEDERCYVYNCPFCHSVEEQQEREAEYLQEQKEAARKRREAELEQHRQEQEQREREQRQAAAAAEEAVQMEATAAAVQASLAAAAERQAAMLQELLDREEAELQLSADALALMKRHKRSACITSLTEMGYSASDAAAAAEAAGCEPAAAASLLLDGGLSGKRPSAVSVIREARELLGEGAKLGLSPTAVEAAVVAADGSWEQAQWELKQARRASQAPSTAGSAASSTPAAPAPAAQAQLARQGSTASSSGTAVASHLLLPLSGDGLGRSWAGVLLPPVAAAPAGSAASSTTSLKDWGSADPQLAGATSAWQQQDAHPSGAASFSSSFNEGFVAGMEAAVRGLQQQPGAPAAAAGVEAQPAAPAEPEAEAAQGWAGGHVPLPQERPPASDAEVDYLLSFMM